MICETIRDRIDEYVRGELDGAAAVEVAKHIDVCSACRDHEACAREIARALPGMKIKGPAVLRSRIVSEALRSPSRSSAAWRWWTLAASLLILAGIYWSLGSPPSPNPGAAPSISAVPVVDTLPVKIAADTQAADGSLAPSSRVAHRELPVPVNHYAPGDTAIHDDLEDTFNLIPNSSRDPLAGDQSEDDEAAARLERLRQRARETGNP
jgi:anti-sigma factor RsiW